MRVAIGGLVHESNAFAPPSTQDDLIDIAPAKMAKAFAGTSTEIAGFVDVADGCADLEYLGFVYGESGGFLDDECVIGLCDRLVERAVAVAPDVVLLALHGSMASPAIDDVEGRLLGELRDVLGDDVTIAATLDWHCSITPAMVAATDLLVGYRTYPHVDQRPRARRAAELALGAQRGEIAPKVAWRHPPMIIAGPATAHENEPMRSILADAARLAEAVPGALDWSLCPGFARSDVPLAGAHVYTAVNGDADAAGELAGRLAALLWERRDEFLPTLATADDALATVEAAAPRPGQPIVLSDQGDNPGGGAAADSTVLLDALLAGSIDGAVVCSLFAPEAVTAAHAAGVGATIDIHGRSAVVEHVADGRYTMRSPTHDGVRRNVGDTATVRIGGIRAVLTTTRVQNEDLQFLEMAGIDVSSATVLAVKSNAHFRAAFGPIAVEIIDVDTPGLSTPLLHRLPFRRIDRPTFPLDDPDWSPVP